MIRSLKIWWFKRKARAAYVRWMRCGNGLDCGLYMTRMIHGAAEQKAAAEFDRYMDKLRSLGEAVPSRRLSAKGGAQ